MQIWWCGDWNFVFINKIPVLAPPKLHLLHWYRYQSNPIIQYRGARTCSGLWATLFWNRGSPYTLILKAGDLQYGPCTSVLIMRFIWHPYQWHWCRSGGPVTRFLFSPKDPVLAPPKPHWLLWYWYQSNPTIILEVQGLVLSHKGIVLKSWLSLWCPTHLYWEWVTSNMVLAPPYKEYDPFGTHTNGTGVNLVVQWPDFCFHQQKSSPRTTKTALVSLILILIGICHPSGGATTSLRP